jgi:hypothetical protein
MAQDVLFCMYVLYTASNSLCTNASASASGGPSELHRQALRRADPHIEPIQNPY